MKKTLSWHLNPFILSNYFQFWFNWKWYIHFNILMHWNSINIWSYSVYFLLIHVQHNFELKKIKEYVLKYFVKKTFFFIVFDVCLRLTFFYLIQKAFCQSWQKLSWLKFFFMTLFCCNPFWVLAWMCQLAWLAYLCFMVKCHDGPRHINLYCHSLSAVRSPSITNDALVF